MSADPVSCGVTAGNLRSEFSVWTKYLTFPYPSSHTARVSRFQKERAENHVWAWWSLNAWGLFLWILFAPYLDITGKSEAKDSSQSGLKRSPAVVGRKVPESLPDRLLPGTWAPTKCESRYQKLDPDQGPLEKELSGCNPLPVERKTAVFFNSTRQSQSMDRQRSVMGWKK